MIKKVKEYVKEVNQYQSWIGTGLCIGLSESESIELIKKLEEAARMIANEPPSAVNTLIIPIIARCYRKYKYLVKNVQIVKIHIQTKIHLLHELCSSAYNNIDGEAEFCAVMAEEIVQLQL